MKHQLLIFTIIVILTNLLHTVMAQQNYPQGLYMTFDEIKRHQPSVTTDIKVVKRTKFDISMYGVNDYKLEPTDKTFKKMIRKKAWAYSDGDTLYLNCKKFIFQPCYAKVQDAGDYLMFDASMSKLSQEYYNNIAKSVMVGYLFGAIGSSLKAASDAQKRYHYVADANTGLAYFVSLDYLDEILSKRHDAVYPEFQTDLKVLNTISNNEQFERTEKLLVDSTSNTSTNKIRRSPTNWYCAMISKCLT